MIIAIDFDGTLCDHRFPEIGNEVPEAFKYLKEFQEAGAKLVLWTMRSDGREDGFNPLTEAIEWCKERGIEFWSHNSNPEQSSWTSSPKCYAHLYIDDAAFGCPLKTNPRSGGRPFVDWNVVGPMVMEMIQK
jgi:FMN phosphatase YigB (HAD superfamily)